MFGAGFAKRKKIHEVLPTFSGPSTSRFLYAWFVKLLGEFHTRPYVTGAALAARSLGATGRAEGRGTKAKRPLSPKRAEKQREKRCPYSQAGSSGREKREKAHYCRNPSFLPFFLRPGPRSTNRILMIVE